MLSTELFRPTFYVRRLMRVAGARGAKVLSGDSTKISHVLLGASFDAIWAALDKIIVLLNLAGWEVREAVIALPWRGDAQHDLGAVRLDVRGGVRFDTGDWRELIAIELDGDAMQAAALRVEVRRSVAADSPHPPIELTGLPGYVADPDPRDDFHDARDGWIRLDRSEYTPLPADGLVAELFQLPHDVLAGLLVGALGRLDQGGAVGLLRSLNPIFWDTALARVAPTNSLDRVAADIWTWLETPAHLDEFLRADLDDKGARFEVLAAAAGSGHRVSTVRQDMRRRADLLHRHNTSLGERIDGLGKTHWLLALMLLHEYGLVAILPFPLAYEPLVPRLDLTGRYESCEPYTDNGRPVFMTLELVQAGDQIRGWLHDTDLRRWQLDAHVDVGPELAYRGTFLRGDDVSTGRVTRLPAQDRRDLTIKLHQGSRSYLMRRVRRSASTDPELFASLVEGKVQPELVPSIVPLHSEVIAAMDRAIDYLATALENWKRRGEFEAPIIVGHLRRKLRDDGVLKYSHTDELVETLTLERFRMRVRTDLPRRTIKGIDGWSVLLNLCVDGGDMAEPLRSFLDLPATNQHVYTYQYIGVGASADLKAGFGASASGYYIGFKLDHHGECAPAQATEASHTWTAYYFGQTVGGSVGLGVGAEWEIGLATSASNKLYASREWSKADFVGAYFIVGSLDGQGSAYATAGGTGGYAGEAYAFFNGDKWATGLGHGWLLGVGFGLGAGIGANAGVTLGKLWARVDRKGEKILDFVTPEPLKLSAGHATKANFEFDSAELTDTAKLFLQRIACRYRALFERPGAFIQIEGDASPEGDEDYNLQLSWRRALSVYAYLRGLLTAPASGEWSRESSGFAIPPSRVHIVAHGEARAREAGVLDGRDDPDWRRIMIVISDTLVVML